MACNDDQAAHVLLGLVLATVPLWAQTEAHLCSPGTNSERSELAHLETATRSVDVAMYSFIDRELAEELAALARRGVRVRVYRGSRAVPAGLQYGGVTMTSNLLAAGIEVRSK